MKKVMLHENLSMGIINGLEMKRSLSDIEVIPTSHNVGEKRVLLPASMSDCSITQIAITDFHAGEVARAHVHVDIARRVLCFEWRT